MSLQHALTHLTSLTMLYSFMIPGILSSQHEMLSWARLTSKHTYKVIVSMRLYVCCLTPWYLSKDLSSEPRSESASIFGRESHDVSKSSKLRSMPLVAELFLLCPCTDQHLELLCQFTLTMHNYKDLGPSASIALWCLRHRPAHSCINVSLHTSASVCTSNVSLLQQHASCTFL